MVQVIGRALDILELLATSRGEVSLTEIYEHLALAPSTVHRIVNQLVLRGYAAQNSVSRSYGPGPKLLEIASRASTNAVFNVQSLARPILRDLTKATGETSNLALPKIDRVVYIDQIESAHLVRMFTEVGHQAPFYCTSVGKAMLSVFPSEQCEEYLATVVLTPFTANTITDRERLRSDIAQARRCGYAVDDEEREAGVRCVAAPILDHRGRCIAGISISGPTTRVSRERLGELGELVHRAAQRCSALLGYGAAAAEQRIDTRTTDEQTTSPHPLPQPFKSVGDID